VFAAARRIAALLCVALTGALGGCAGYETPGSGPAAEAPTYHVGDRWTYRAQDGFRVLERWEEVHTITAVGADGIAARITQNGPTRNIARAELWPAPGLVKVGAVYENQTRRFATPLERYRFPLAAGGSWSQFVDTYDETAGKAGQINHYVRVLRWETVTTPAGTFDAIVMQVLMRLDDEQFWRYATDCNYLVWYAPAVRGVVRAEERASYQEKGGDMDSGARVTTQHATVELVAFAPGS
jgi:hypothetical protein